MNTGERPVVVFDGACPLCLRWISRLRRWDRGESFEYLALQDPDVAERYPEIAPEEFESAMHLIEPDGTPRAGADAVEAILDHLPRGILLSWLFHLPFARPIARRIYRRVAERRARTGCGEHCRTR